MTQATTTPDNRDDLNNSRFIDWRLICDGDAFQEHVSELSMRIEEDLGINWRDSDRKKHKEALSCVLLNLYKAHKSDKYIALPLGSDYYTSMSAIYFDGLSLSFIGDNSVKQLEEKNLIELYIGSYDRNANSGKYTRIRAAASLSEKLEELLQDQRIKKMPFRTHIWLKNTNKRCIAIPAQHQHTFEELERNILKINELLKTTPIKLFISDEQLTNLKEHMKRKKQEEEEASKKRIPVTDPDVGNKELVRIFNNKSFEQGGRFYKGFWQNIPKEYRKFITINNNPTIEVDFQAIHVHLLHLLNGSQPTYTDDPYTMCLEHLPEEHQDAKRKDVKHTFFKLINKSTMRGLSAKEKAIKAAIIQTHPIVGDYLCSGKGVFLQAKDSQIAEGIMLKLAEQGIAALPIHDSFIVEHQHYQKLVGAMRDSYKDIMAADIAPEKDFSIDKTQPTQLPRITEDNRADYSWYLES